MVGDGFNLIDAGVPVRNGGEHSQLVFGLMGRHLPAAHELGFHVGSHLQDGRRGKIRLAHRAHGIRRAGPGAGQDNTGPPGSAGIAVGHIAATQLQPPANKAHGVLPVKQRVEKIQGMHGDDAENGINPVSFQSCDHRLAAGHLGHN